MNILFFNKTLQIHVILFKYIWLIRFWSFLTMKKLRKEIIALKQFGISGTRKSKLLKVPKSTVFDAIKRFEELGGYSDRSRRGGSPMF